MIEIAAGVTQLVERMFRASPQGPAHPRVKTKFEL
jgi:hypothetical protein